MSVLLRIVWINFIIVPVTAILCNILLLCLTKVVKTKTLILLNYSLVPNSILDIILSIVTFIVAPHVFQIEGNFYVVIGDLFASMEIFNTTAVNHLTALFSGLFITNMISITISFYIRYLVICRHVTISFKTMILPYFLLFIYFIICYILFLWFYLFSNDFTKKPDATLVTVFWKKEFGTDPLIFANKSFSPPLMCCCVFILTTFTFSYCLIFYYSNRISTTLKTHIESNNSGTKLLHKQIQRTLFIQAFGPSLIGSIPALLLVLKIVLQLKSSDISLILSLFFPWVSITNPIAAFIFIKPYRNYIKTMLKCFLNPFNRHGNTLIIFPSHINNK